MKTSPAEACWHQSSHAEIDRCGFSVGLIRERCFSCTLLTFGPLPFQLQRIWLWHYQRFRGSHRLLHVSHYTIAPLCTRGHPIRFLKTGIGCSLVESPSYTGFAAHLEKSCQRRKVSGTLPSPFSRTHPVVFVNSGSPSQSDGPLAHSGRR
jgi:hypothetical protein